MKFGKIVAVLSSLLAVPVTRQRNELQILRGVMKELRVKERHLRDKHSSAMTDDEREEFTGKLEVLRAQRIKGLARIKALRNRSRA